MIILICAHTLSDLSLGRLASALLHGDAIVMMADDRYAARIAEQRAAEANLLAAIKADVWDLKHAEHLLEDEPAHWPTPSPQKESAEDRVMPRYRFAHWWHPG